MQGAFEQTYTPLEIILSDDCSTDRTFEIMEEMAGKYNGINKVILCRNEKNLGLIEHINKLMKIENGELIIVAAGDDISLPDRVQLRHSLHTEIHLILLFVFFVENGSSKPNWFNY